MGIGGIGGIGGMSRRKCINWCNNARAVTNIALGSNNQLNKTKLDIASLPADSASILQRRLEGNWLLIVMHGAAINNHFGWSCRNGAAPVTDKLLKIGDICSSQAGEKANKYLSWLCADIVDTEKQML